MKVFPRLKEERSVMIEFFERARRAFKDTRAQDLVEYALIAGFVAMSLSAAFPAAARPWRRLARKPAKVAALAAGTSSSFSC